MLKYLLILIIFISSVYSNENHNYLLEYYKQNEIYNKDTNKQYDKFLKSYKNSLKKYKSYISKYWQDILITSKHTFVYYSNNFKQRSIINYKKSTITIEVITKDSKLAQIQIVKRYKKLFELTHQEAFRNELILRNTYRNLNIIYDTPIDNDLLIGEFVDDKYKQNIILKSSLEEYQENIYKDYKYFSSTYKLPKDFKSKNENRYINIIKKHAKISKIPYKVYYAMIKIKTSFNPYALTSDARFSLMLVDPKEKGLKAYYKLYKDKRILDASYLYNIENNLLIASTYFSILYYDEFKNIQDNKSKLYLSILAYEIGVDKTLNIFENTEDINTLNSSIIYKTILKKTKNRKLRIYFSKVTRLML
jgi:membrane-bound lytic murein transglycosylase C